MITKLKVQTKESSSRWNYGRVFQFSRGSVAKRSPYKSGIRWPKQQKRRMLTTGLLSKLFTIEGWMTHLGLKWSKCVLSGNVHKLTITDRLDQQQEEIEEAFGISLIGAKQVRSLWWLSHQLSSYPRYWYWWSTLRSMRCWAFVPYLCRSHTQEFVMLSLVYKFRRIVVNNLFWL